MLRYKEEKIQNNTTQQQQEEKKNVNKLRRKLLKR